MGTLFLFNLERTNAQQLEFNRLDVLEEATIMLILRRAHERGRSEEAAD